MQLLVLLCRDLKPQVGVDTMSSGNASLCALGLIFCEVCWDLVGKGGGRGVLGVMR
jgi:hypothetical protein